MVRLYYTSHTLRSTEAFIKFWRFSSADGTWPGLCLNLILVYFSYKCSLSLSLAWHGPWSLCPGGPIKLLHITQHCNIVTEVTEEPRSCGCIDDHHDICPVSYKPDQLSGIYYSANQCRLCTVQKSFLSKLMTSFTLHYTVTLYTVRIE